LILGSSNEERKTTHKIPMERLNLKKLNEEMSKVQCQFKISNRLAVLGNLGNDVDVNKT
jgi:hypothetical protein